MKYFTYETFKRLSLFTFFSILIIFSLSSCKKDFEPASYNEVLSFAFIKSNGIVIDSSQSNVSIRHDSIYVIVPARTDLTHLTPHITIKGVSISPESGVEENFLSPVQYTIKTENGATRTYTVTVSRNIPHNLVFVGSSNNTFYALDAITGDLKWEYNGSKGFSYSSPTVENSIVYAGSIDNNLYAFDAASGKVLWKFATSGGIDSSPNIVNKVVYVGSDDNNLYAFDAISGQVKWTYTANALFNSSSPVVKDSMVFIGNRDGNLYALDEITGNLKWKNNTNGISLEQSSPSVANGIVYIGGWYNLSDFTKKGSVYAVNEATGNLVWTSLDSLGFSSSPYIGSGALFISADDMNFYSLNAQTGKVNWKLKIIPNGSRPTVANGVVFVGGGGTGYFYAIDAQTGNEKWRFPISNGILTSRPCVIGPDGTIFHPGISGE